MLISLFNMEKELGFVKKIDEAEAELIEKKEFLTPLNCFSLVGRIMKNFLAGDMLEAKIRKYAKKIEADFMVVDNSFHRTYADILNLETQIVKEKYFGGANVSFYRNIE